MKWTLGAEAEVEAEIEVEVEVEAGVEVRPGGKVGGWPAHSVCELAELASRVPLSLIFFIETSSYQGLEEA